MAVYGIDLIDVYFLELATGNLSHESKSREERRMLLLLLLAVGTVVVWGTLLSFLGLYLLLLILFNHLKKAYTYIIYMHQV